VASSLPVEIWIARSNPARAVFTSFTKEHFFPIIHTAQRKLLLNILKIGDLLSTYESALSTLALSWVFEITFWSQFRSCRVTSVDRNFFQAEKNAIAKNIDRIFSLCCVIGHGIYLLASCQQMDFPLFHFLAECVHSNTKMSMDKEWIEKEPLLFIKSWYGHSVQSSLKIKKKVFFRQSGENWFCLPSLDLEANLFLDTKRNFFLVNKIALPPVVLKRGQWNYRDVLTCPQSVHTTPGSY
jgi:hypothetical protein